MDCNYFIRIALAIAIALTQHLVQWAEDWEFASYQDYVELRHGTLPKFDAVLQRVGDSQSYRTFVEANDNPLQPTVRHLMLDE